MYNAKHIILIQLNDYTSVSMQSQTNTQMGNDWKIVPQTKTIEKLH